MKRSYEKPLMFAETFVSNQYVAACKEPMYNVTPTQVRCESPGHKNTQSITMFTDQQTSCVALFVPKVGSVQGDKFKTQFEACAYVNGCNRKNYTGSSWQHAREHASFPGANNGAFINHDTTIDLSLAQKYNLS